MRSREKILENILKAQLDKKPLPSLLKTVQSDADSLKNFSAMLEGIGGKVIISETLDFIPAYVSSQYASSRRIVSTIPDLPWYVNKFPNSPHLYEDVDLAILYGHFGVAENGAVWVTDSAMGDRALPFICQHIALVVHQDNIVPTLAEAYEIIDGTTYDYGTFIAGPSKTADIEQSLVLGAHGPKSLTVFLIS